MAETLTQAEIDALRDAVRTGRIEEVAKEPRAKPAAEVKVVSYDFRKPQLLSAEHLQQLQSLHQGLAKNLQSLLFSMFKISGETTLSALDQVSYGEFMLAVESPTYLLGVSIEGAGPIGVEVAPPLGQIILDMLLGGDGIASASEPSREFSALELDIMRTWVDRVMEELTLAWSGIHTLTFSVFTQGVEPEQAQVVPLDTPCLCGVFKLRMNEAEGRLQVCYPFSTLQAIFQRVEADSVVAVGQQAELRKNALQAIELSPLSTHVELGRAQISARELSELRIGDIIKLGRRAGDPLVLDVGGRGIGTVRAGIHHGQLAACVQQLFSKRPTAIAGAPAGTAAPVTKPKA
jgi:flagellar motor switch protein FliM